MITKLLLKLIQWWDYDFPILLKTSKGNWIGVADFKEGHTLIQDEQFPSVKTAKVVQNDYVSLKTPNDCVVTVKFEGTFK